MFDYWRDSSDLSLLFSACGLSRAKSSLSGEVQFEQKFSIDGRFQYAPNLDVVFYPSPLNKYKAFAIECKFTEAYSSYIGTELIWKIDDAELCCLVYID